MSSAIPNALFSIGVKAPAADARLQRPSESAPELSSRDEFLKKYEFKSNHYPRKHNCSLGDKFNLITFNIE